MLHVSRGGFRHVQPDRAPQTESHCRPVKVGQQHDVFWPVRKPQYCELHYFTWVYLMQYDILWLRGHGTSYSKIGNLQSCSCDTKFCTNVRKFRWRPHIFTEQGLIGFKSGGPACEQVWSECHDLKRDLKRCLIVPIFISTITIQTKLLSIKLDLTWSYFHNDSMSPPAILDLTSETLSSSMRKFKSPNQNT